MFSWLVSSINYEPSQEKDMWFSPTTGTLQVSQFTCVEWINDGFYVPLFLIMGIQTKWDKRYLGAS